MTSLLLVGEMALTAFLAFVIVYSVLYPNLWPVKGRYVKQAQWRSKPWLLHEGKGLCEFEGKELIDVTPDKAIPFVLKTFDGVEFKENFCKNDLKPISWHNLVGQAPEIFMTKGVRNEMIGDAQKELVTQVEELNHKLEAANEDSNDWRIKYETLNSNFDTKLHDMIEKQIELAKASAPKKAFNR